jgi:hypothetical protein
VTRLARASILAASVAVLTCGFWAASPASSSAAEPFRRLIVLYEPSQGLREFATDGVRFAVIHHRNSNYAPLVFDTFRARRFLPRPPLPGCQYRYSGAGLLVWSCPGPSGWRPEISELATGTVREPVGWDAVAAMESEHYRCHPGPIGRRWLTVWCGFGIGPTTELYLNHRTGEVMPEIFPSTGGHWFPNLDLADFGLDVCAPLERAILGAYVPPFALQSLPSADGDFSTTVDELRLRRCGSRPAEILSRCPDDPCVNPQLSGRYVTWGEGERVFAYLPRIRRRVLVGRAPAAIRPLPGELRVAHTCNRVFAQWSNTLYVARFKPRRGAPPCQRRHVKSAPTRANGHKPRVEALEAAGLRE